MALPVPLAATRRCTFLLEWSFTVAAPRIRGIAILPPPRLCIFVAILPLILKTSLIYIMSFRSRGGNLLPQNSRGSVFWASSKGPQELYHGAGVTGGAGMGAAARKAVPHSGQKLPGAPVSS